MHVAITGASSGIGAALAREFARGGATLTLVARRKPLLDALAEECGVACHVVAHDLSDPSRAAAWIEDAERALGPIDVLINNAGIENTGPTPTSDLEGAHRLLATNLLSPLTMTRTVLPQMVARKNGTIVDIASVAAFLSMPRQTWYGASKAGLASFSEALRAEIAETGVHVVTVYPGPVTTPMAEAAYVKLGGRDSAAGMLPEGSPEVLADLVRRAVELRRKRVIYPRFYVLARWFPWFGRWLVDLATPHLPWPDDAK